MRAGTLDPGRVAVAVALGHEAAALTGVAPADLPPVTPATDSEYEALAAADLTDDVVLVAVMAPLERYRRRLEAVLQRLQARERLLVARACVDPVGGSWGLKAGADAHDVAHAIDSAARHAKDEAAAVAWQTERLCAALLGLA